MRRAAAGVRGDGERERATERVLCVCVLGARAFQQGSVVLRSKHRTRQEAV